MIEIILVLLILSVLFFALRNIFQIKDKEVIYGQTCVENLYGTINSFLDAASRSRGLNSGNELIYPDQYQVFLSPSSNTIELTYVASGTTFSYQQFLLSGSTLGNWQCQGNNYSIQLSGNDLKISVNKGLTQNSQFQSFILSGAMGFTGHVDVFQCITNAPFCKQIAQFIADTRTQSVQKKLCLSINTGGLCNIDGWDK